MHWEPMAEETFEKINLQPNSEEYQEVAQGFQKTAKQYKIHKVSDAHTERKRERELLKAHCDATAYS